MRNLTILTLLLIMGLIAFPAEAENWYETLESSTQTPGHYFEAYRQLGVEEQSSNAAVTTRDYDIEKIEEELKTSLDSVVTYAITSIADTPESNTREEIEANTGNIGAEDEEEEEKREPIRTISP